MQPLGKAILCVSLLALSACEPSTPSRADTVRGLPAVSMDTALSAFTRVCAASKPSFSRAKELQATLTNPDAFIFDASKLRDGTPVCSMRARLPADQNAFQELQRRYGKAQSTGGLLTVFNGYSGGQLIFMSGIKNGAGEGTFQIGLMSGRSL